jgi:glycine/D-amino acid oxidase-like deaminating enzyme/nitrite reductase/ring-hydroxylating ferredoxin subunit
LEKSQTLGDMMDFSQSKPLWLEGERPEFSGVSKDIKTDVVIVGGGVTGLTAAYLALTAGKSVCLLERDRLGRGDSGHSTAHLTGLTDARLSRLVSSFGKSGASLAWFAGFYAIEEIARLINEAQIDCGFRRVDGYLHETLDQESDEARELIREVKLAQELGFNIDFVESAPIVQRPAMHLRDQAFFDPVSYLYGLASAVIRRGGQVFELSEVTNIEGDPSIVTANGQHIECEMVLIATHVPILGKASFTAGSYLQTKLVAYSSYVLSGRLPSKSVPEVSLCDTSDPYYYLRAERFADFDRVIFGGEDHKTGQAISTNEIYTALEEKLRSILPQIQIDHRWSGQVIHTVDGLPFIGEIEKGQFIATGFNGNGITFATIAALMFRDTLLEESNPWQDLFSITRSILRPGIWEYVKTNLDYPYYMAIDRMKRQSPLIGDPLLGEGRVVDVDGQKVACSRDREGRLHQVSAVCPHLGCVVHWNDGELSWDCPCHGSRFRPNGEVLTGPAERSLQDLSGVTAVSTKVEW